MWGLKLGLGGARDTQQKIAEWLGGGIPNARLVLAADHCDNTDAPGLLIPVTVYHPLWDALVSA
jgi:hypothetical protein